jgi:hypothetical protein
MIASHQRVLRRQNYDYNSRSSRLTLPNFTVRSCVHGNRA